ncbi:MAG: hypothetical protein KF726_02510 [Anaerolineae bacterium]|nr:hypothetical protein [Anaerolineae bacterium]
MSKRQNDKLTRLEKAALKNAIRTRFGIAVGRLNALIDDNDDALDAVRIERLLTSYLRTVTKG